MDEYAVPARARVHDAPLGTVPRRLMASWRRSEDYGVPLEEIQPVFNGTFDDESLFFQCGREVLADLHRTLASEPVSLMLTDADGLLLNRLSGDHSLLRALDAVHLAPGFSYSEREAGTNGLGLALADRSPTVVKAEQHYALSLCTYTCAAAPVIDPVTGRLEGAVNLTTWSKSSSELLLALAQSAARATASLMLARAQGHRPRPAPRGEVFRVEAPRLEPGAGTDVELSAAWVEALGLAVDGLAAGRVVAALGESGSGRSTLLAQAERRVRPRDRILAASAPAPQDVEAWLSLWTPELTKPHTGIVMRDVDALPVWAAEQLRDLIQAAHGVPVSMTAERFEDIPAPLALLVESVVPVPALRDRPSDILPLARHIARRLRGRDVAFTAAADRALGDHSWRGNVEELVQVVRHAVNHADVIDVRHLSPTVLAGSSRRLSRIEAFERDEIIRVLTHSATSMKDAADELGMSRATVYRKIAQYDIHIPKG
ncbi:MULTISPECIES: GAF domain-containing protein [unclassified Nocardioides]|uniref:GAF domain-containing protein n=1 Tax=unclassified Nocardioides TaxID=2615069 RepID=UPI0009F04DBE|nr:MULTISPECIES: GAF domain-containing protein [unclassified Nocardioides]GAW48692.1 Fis family transcriptional regulator [Nocardioides sp. PD653-B2]GAW54209.1 Fis family transcriptional regulator [Nocardioides sp. PD653]